ncbi:MAG: signal peptidase I [Bacilli bacterium]|nr:signal peptidase I [Bacilli bacterium]
MENTILSNKVENLEETRSTVLSSIVYCVKFLLKIVINFALICLFIVTLLVTLVFIDDEVNKLRGIDVPPILSTYVIVSPSMTPTIKVQDAVLVIRSNKFKKGDIVTFKTTDPRYSGYTITHRINDVITANNGKTMYITKGDNNSIVDAAPVFKDNIYGKVILKIPYLGSIKNIFFQPFILFMILLIPSLIFVIYNMFLYLKTLRKDSTNNEISENLLDNNANLNIIEKKEEEIEIL